MISTRAIINEITLGITQEGVALSYAMAMVSEQRGEGRPDWLVINAAIAAKWKVSGLERVKKRARSRLLRAGRDESDHALGGLQSVSELER